MFTECVGAANLKFSLDYERAINELKKQIGSIAVKCAADGVLHSSVTDNRVYEACITSISRLSDEKLAYDLVALTKAGKSITEYLEWLNNRQEELLLISFSGFVDRLVKDKPYLANVRSMIQAELYRVLSRASTKAHIAALEQVSDNKTAKQTDLEGGNRMATMKKKIQVFVSSTYTDIEPVNKSAHPKTPQRTPCA